jgi:acyl-CoA synthetase (AMP-forming)/AMP-acid ligase II
LARSACCLIVAESGLLGRASDLASEGGLLPAIDLGDDGVVSSEWEAILAAATPDAEGLLPPRLASDGAPLNFTSGTSTGRPKAVVRLAAGQRLAQVDLYGLWGLTAQDRILIVTPFFHGNGFGGAISSLGLGASVVFQRRFSATRFWPVVGVHRPTFFFTLMPIVNILLSLPPSDDDRTSSIRTVLALGASPQADLMRARYGWQVLDFYGLTEAGGIASTRLHGPQKPGAIGPLLPGKVIHLLDQDGETCAAGEVGEVCLECDHIGFGGYLDDPEASAAAVRDGLFHTGDLGRLDEDGFFSFVDRVKDIVRRGGENISSLEVEAVLADHPGVAEVAVLGWPDAVLGERVAAAIVPPVGGEPPELAELRAFAAERLAAYKLPERLVIVAALPRTTNGKVRKSELRRAADPSRQP